MSLFERDGFRWRETYFVLFEEQHRPTTKQVTDALSKLDPRFELIDLREDDEGRFESVTVLAPDDYSAMDISFVAGEDVTSQVDELRSELRGSATNGEEQRKLSLLNRCDARFDILHFEQVVDDDDQDEFLDPGALLKVLERLARLTHGVGIDPQSGGLM